jgi:hypothetical protein
MEPLPGQTAPQYDPSILPTLDQVYAHFQQWRTTRKCKGKIPSALWNQVFLLLDRYRETDICNKLSISKSRLHAAMLPKSSQDTQASVDFVPLTLAQPTLQLDPKTKNFIAEILHANGTRLRITSLSEHQFSTLLHTFMESS